MSVFEIDFEGTLPAGECICLHLTRDAASRPAELLHALTPEEQTLASNLPPVRLTSFASGRIALRLALRRLGVDAPCLAISQLGAPALPPHVVGSISHKGLHAVGLAARDEGFHVGVDLELPRPRRTDISSVVLTPGERHHLERLAPEDRARSVLLHFSLKEALYKALSPRVQRYVDFQEVSVEPLPDGTARFTLALAAGEGPFETTGWWRLQAGFLLTMARASG